MRRSSGTDRSRAGRAVAAGQAALGRQRDVAIVEDRPGRSRRRPRKLAEQATSDQARIGAEDSACGGNSGTARPSKRWRTVARSPAKLDCGGRTRKSRRSNRTAGRRKQKTGEAPLRHRRATATALRLKFSFAQ